MFASFNKEILILLEIGLARFQIEFLQLVNSWVALTGEFDDSRLEENL